MPNAHSSHYCDFLLQAYIPVHCVVYVPHKGTSYIWTTICWAMNEKLTLNPLRICKVTGSEGLSLVLHLIMVRFLNWSQNQRCVKLFRFYVFFATLKFILYLEPWSVTILTSVLSYWKFELAKVFKIHHILCKVGSNQIEPKNCTKWDLTVLLG